MRNVYLVGVVAGFLFPIYFLIRFLRNYGFDLAALAQQMFGTPIAAFFVMDVVISSLVLWAFVFKEGRRLGMKNLWVYVALNLLVGVSLALPAFLYMREERLGGRTP